MPWYCENISATFGLISPIPFSDKVPVEGEGVRIALSVELAWLRLNEHH